MRFEVDMGDVGVSLDRFAHRVGETTEQATVRYGVAAARSLAEATEPKRSTVKSRRKSTEVFMRRVVMSMNGNTINKLMKNGGGRIRITKSGSKGSEWSTIGVDRIITNANALWRWIESNRVGGKTKDLSAKTQKRVCSKTVFDSVAKRRSGLWGAAKGAWIGAGMDIARRQAGLNRISIGKNFIPWVKKHAPKGSGRQTGRDHDTAVLLTNNTTGAAKSTGLSIADIQSALNKARRAVWSYYAGELRRMRIGKGSR
jgi:hypothetical protein